MPLKVIIARRESFNAEKKTREALEKLPLSASVSNIKGIGDMFERRFRKEYGVTTLGQLLELFRKEKGNREKLLTKMLLGVKDPTKPNKLAFEEVSVWLRKHGIKI